VSRLKFEFCYFLLNARYLLRSFSFCGPIITNLNKDDGLEKQHVGMWLSTEEKLNL